MQNFESPHHSTHKSNDWDMSQVPFAGDEVTAENSSPESEQFESEVDPSETAIENVQYWGQSYNNLESQFMEHRQNIDLDDPGSRERYKTMLRRYEDEVSHVWGYMEDATKTANSYNRLGDPYSRSAAQGINVPGGEEGSTIEACSSIFYGERVNALRAAIQDDPSLTPEEMEDRGRLLRSTWSKVLDRIEANQDIAERRRDPVAHFYYCNELHDNLIRHLNQMNDFAKSYHLEPFTPRNFITNDRNYSELRDRNGDYHARVETDRSIVDYYFRQVFSREYTKIDYKTSRDLGLTA